jgi:hypothetical protein
VRQFFGSGATSVSSLAIAARTALNIDASRVRVRNRRRHVRAGAFGASQIVEDDLPDAGNVRFGNRFAL